MFTISHDHSYIGDKPNITRITRKPIAEENVDPSATTTALNENISTEDASPINVQSVEDSDGHMQLYTIKGQADMIEDTNRHTLEETNEENMAVSEAESGVVNTEYTVLESGDLESIEHVNDQTILVYNELGDRNQYTQVEDDGSSQALLYLDHGSNTYDGNGIVSVENEPLLEETTELAVEGTGLSEDAHQLALYSIGQSELSVNECAHEMNLDGICQKCGEFDLSLLGNTGPDGKTMEEEESPEKEPVVLKIDVYDRYGDAAVEAEEDPEELDERSELQGNLVLSIEIKVNPDLSTGYYSGKMYLCNVNCDFHTTDAVNMLNHFKQHHGEYEYEYTMYEFKRYMISLSQSFRHTHSDYCSSCSSRRADAAVFMKCRRFRYLCRACRFSARGNHPLVDHLQVHTHRQFHCQLCSRACPAKRPLAEHLRQCHGTEGRLYVGLPPQLTERAPDAPVPWAHVRKPKKKRRRAKERVIRPSPCKCPKCDFTADTHTELMNHLVLMHIKKYTLLRRKTGPATMSSSGTSVVKRFVVCDFCEFRAINQAMLDRHVAVKHTETSANIE